MRILLFGDSITYGVFDSQGGWAQRIVNDQLMAQLAHLDDDIPFAYNLGFSGDTTAHLAGRLPAETEARFGMWSHDTAMAFVIAIGVNDTQVIDGKPFSSPRQYAKDLTLLLEAAKQYSTKVLFVGLLPCQDKPWAAQTYNVDRIWEFEQALRSFVATHNLPFVPLFEQFQERLAAGETLLIEDGLHPNDAGHQLIYDHVRLALDSMLRKS